jgi:hypothetical protein
MEELLRIIRSMKTPLWTNSRQRARVTTVFLAGCLITACTIARGQQSADTSGVTNSHGVEAHSADTKKASRSIELSRINKDFIQNGGSCVLASYAMVGNYFTGKPVTTYFEGYCKHFKLDYANAAEAEQKYAAHVDAEWRKRNCRGYEVILDLHSNSTVKCFVEARAHFDGQFYLDSAAHREELENLLAAKEAFLNITYEPGGGYHSITVVHGDNGFLARDTNRKGLFPLDGLAKIGKLRDSVLYISK